MTVKTTMQRLREATAAASQPALLRARTNGDEDSADQAREAESSLATADDAADVADAACSACGGEGVANGVVCDDCNGRGRGGTSSAKGDVEIPEVDADSDSGDATVPEVRGAGGRGKQTAPEVSREAEQRIARLVERDLTPAAFAVTLREATIALPADAVDAMSPLAASVLREAGPLNRSAQERRDFAKQGKAMPDGSYPIGNHDELDAAIKSVGSGGSDHGDIRKHIIKNAKALGADSKIPDNWGSDGSTKESAALEDMVKRAVAEAMGGVREAQPGQLNYTFDNGPVTRVKNQRGQDGYDVTLIREGYGNAEDNRWYPGSAIKDLCESGRAEGMQAFANHPTISEEDDRPERDVKELIGTHTDVHYVEEAGVPKAKSVFVPISADPHHPHYGWVSSLAEAAVQHRGPQPLVGWSLYGLSAGHDDKRPDGTEGQIADMILPSSGDMVTNAGAGGEFARRLMLESARRLRRANNSPPKGDYEMLTTQYRARLAEAHRTLREADSDEKRNAAWAEIDKIETEAGARLDTPTVPGSIEELTEAAPALVQSLRETARREAATDVEGLRTQLHEANDKLGQAEKVLGQVADVQRLAEAVRAADVTDDAELQHYIAQAQIRGLREAEDVRAMIEAERGYDQQREEALLTKVRETIAEEFGGDVEFTTRTPSDANGDGDGGLATLREAGIPTVEQAAA